MKNFIRLSLAAALCCSAAFAGTYQQKTFLSPRVAGSASPLLTTLEFPWRAEKAQERSSYVTATAFYQESLNGNDLGKYFGFGNGTNSFTIGGAAPTWLDSGKLLHGGGVASATLSLRPKQQVGGVRLDARHDFDGKIKGVFVRAALPVAYVKNDLRAKFDSSVAFGTLTFADLFAGKVTQVGRNAQNPLKYGKIAKSRNTTGIADLTLGLGYNLVAREDTRVELAGMLLVPTGNKVKAEYLFEPVVGNGRHFGFGGDLDAMISLWHDDRGRVVAHGALHYAYLTEATEKRIPGLPYDSENRMNQYALAGARGTNVLEPAVNFLAQDYRIKPGSQAEMLLDVSFVGKRFSAAVGYDLFWKDAETAHRRSSQDVTVGVATNGVDMTSAGGLGVRGAAFEIEPADFAKRIDYDAVKTPAQVTHTFFGGVGYSMEIREFPVVFGLGGSYEFAQDNSSFEQWGIWLKAGVAF